MSTPFHTRR